MDIKLPPNGQPAQQTSTPKTTVELPASLQQLPRGTLLNATVQSSNPIPVNTPIKTKQSPTQPGQTSSPSQSPTSTQSASNSSAPAPQPAATNQRLFNVVLNIGGASVQTQSNYNFSLGQQLQVEITGNSALQVRNIQQKSPPIAQDLLQIQQGLRQALPIQQSSRFLLNNLTPLFQLLTQLQMPSEPLKTQIRNLLTTIPDIKQLSNPQVLKNSVNQSGIFLEAKVKLVEREIQRLLQQGGISTAQTKQSSSQLNQANIGNRFGFNGGSAENSAFTSSSPPSQTQPSKTTKTENNPRQGEPAQNLPSRQLLQSLLKDNALLAKQLQQIIGQDFKAQLLKLSSQLLPLLNNAEPRANQSTPPEASILQRIAQALPDTLGTQHKPSSPAQLSLPNLPITTPLLQLLHPHILAGRQPTSSNAQNHTAQLDLATGTILRQIAASLAQVQANQLQSLVAPKADTDGGQLIHSWNLEIPVFLDGQFKPIQLHINEERHPEHRTPENEKRRVWKITLGFDFDGLGEFFATLRIIDNSVSATFWSERPETLQQINKELQHLGKSLRKVGLNVEELECRRGKPSIQETRLDQQLVDIKT